MKKGLFIIAGAALVLSSCQEDGIRNNYSEDFQTGISFETFSNKVTRGEGAENSGKEANNGLAKFHDSFFVWGSKYVNGTQTPVFTKQIVNYASAADGWKYTPVRFWDKTADKYDFYAAAPATQNWVWNNNAKQLTLSAFAVTGATLAPTFDCLADAEMPDVDIMISNDVVRDDLLNKKTYDRVELLFNHILSRLNIAVRKDKVLDEFIVKLNSIQVYDMLQQGDFSESYSSADASGSAARWENQSAKYTFGYTASGDGVIASGDAYKYYYQGLVIPQEVACKNIKLDGSDATTSGAPYICINYTLYTASGEAEIEVPGGNFVYYYNLAKIFNNYASGDAAVAFNEGWMNTLKITIKPDVIEFTPEVADWATYKDVEVYVPASGDATK